MKETELKQIEEMAKELRPLTLCPNCLSSFNDNGKRDGGCYRPIEYKCPLDGDILRYCEALYNADYRKQSEGEWVKHPLATGVRYCSNCGENRDSKSGNFCPNCGAKMSRKEDERNGI